MDARPTITLTPGTHSLGRSAFHLTDQRVSRTQIRISVDFSDGLASQPILHISSGSGLNPTVVKRSNNSNVRKKREIVLQPCKRQGIRTCCSRLRTSQCCNWFPLYHRDKIFVLPDLYPFQVLIEPEHDPSFGKNFLFYSGKISCQPNNVFIDEIHDTWAQDLSLLEHNHSYIQWLFPLFSDSGVNTSANKLEKAEAQLMRNNIECARRIVKSYRMMLNFYGLELLDDTTGQIARHTDPSFCSDRYLNLSLHSHNNLRITRIITSLGHLGFSKYKVPLVRHFTEEILRNKELSSSKYSLKDYWQPLLELNSSRYIEKTMERQSDRQDSVWFSQSR